MLSKREAETDEDAIGLQRGVVVRVKVKQTKAIATKQIEVAELHIDTEYGIQVETVSSAIVAVPVGAVFTKDGVGALGGTRESETRHRTDKGNEGQVAVHSDLVVEQNRHVDDGLGLLDFSSEAPKGLSGTSRVHTELRASGHTDTFGKANVLAESDRETLVIRAVAARDKSLRSISCINS